MEYNINLDIKYGHFEVIDVPELASSIAVDHFNQTLTRVNDSVIRLGILNGEFHWHKHETDDEFFYVVSGHLRIDLEHNYIELEPGQGVTISKGVMHRPRTSERTVLLMVETANIQPEGDRTSIN